MARAGMQSPSNGTVPNPDPTARTVEQMERDLSAERAITSANNKATREILETRLHAMDKAISLLQDATDKIPSHIKYEVKQLRELHEEKHKSIAAQIEIKHDGIATQFSERDKRTEQLSIADKTAIAAALQAQKEAAGATTEMVMAAITKMDVNFTKLIDQTQNLQQVGFRNTDEKNNDLKARIDRGEGHGKGISDVWGWVVGAAGISAAIVSIAAILVKG